jgi:hypothetical protein
MPVCASASPAAWWGPQALRSSSRWRRRRAARMRAARWRREPSPSSAPGLPTARPPSLEPPPDAQTEAAPGTAPAAERDDAPPVDGPISSWTIVRKTRRSRKPRRNGRHRPRPPARSAQARLRPARCSCSSCSRQRRCAGRDRSDPYREALALAERLARADAATPRWIGKDALRVLRSPTVERRLAKRAARKRSAS